MAWHFFCFLSYVLPSFRPVSGQYEWSASMLATIQWVISLAPRIIRRRGLISRAETRDSWWPWVTSQKHNRIYFLKLSLAQIFTAYTLGCSIAICVPWLLYEKRDPSSVSQGFSCRRHSRILRWSFSMSDSDSLDRPRSLKSLFTFLTVGLRP